MSSRLRSRCFDEIQGKEVSLAESEFSGVTVVKAANVYFDGKVTSRSVKFDDGTVKTLGIMLPGDYDFGTEAAESMEIICNRLELIGDLLENPPQIPPLGFNEETVF